MPKTTFNIQNRKKPAPKGYRKFENMFLIILLPAIIALVQGWGFPDAVLIKVNLVLTFIGTIVKAIGFFLANGESYVQQKNFNINEK